VTRKGKEMSDLGIARWWKGAGARGRTVPKRATGRAITRSIGQGTLTEDEHPHLMIWTINLVVKSKETHD